MSIEEKKSFFSLVGYGVHSKYQKSLRARIREEFSTKTAFVYEYFLTRPIVRNKEKNRDCSTHAPSLLRILNESKFVPKMERKMLRDKPQRWLDIEELSWDLTNVIDFWNSGVKGAGVSDIRKYTLLGTRALALWETGKMQEEKAKGNKKWTEWMEYEESSGIVKANFKFPIRYLRGEYLSDMSTFDDASYIGSLKEYVLVVLPWLRSVATSYLNIALLSLSSPNIFYGGILIFYPDVGRLREKEGILKSPEGEESRVIRTLKDFIKNTYVPVLLFFENLWEEKELQQELDTEPDWDKYVFLCNSLDNSNDPFERAMHGLWEKRRALYETYPSKDKIKRISDSLLFSKYIISSPAMVDEIRKIVTPRHPREATSYLPCFLVIGGPGSGKDTIAKIIQLFFPEYRFGKRYTINMAQLKPNYISVPLMSGGEIELVRTISSEPTLDDSPRIEMQIKGIFKKIWERHKEEHPDLEKAREQGMMPVLILDELNSLDVDAQGALLRVLENARLQSLGSPQPEGEEETVDFLVVGTVNEPEEVLTLEEPLHDFLMERSIFGGALGKVLYEYFRNMRRLREDLFHRLVRDGKIHTLDLNKRREDIPILFSFFVKQALPDKIGWDNLWFDFDVFEELMRETYSWSGNFRQLQSAAKKTANCALLDCGNRKVLQKLHKGKEVDEFFVISMEHLGYVLKELRKKEIRSYDSATNGQ